MAVLSFHYTTGASMTAKIEQVSGAGGTIWDGSAMTAYATASPASITVTETAVGGIYSMTIPAALPGSRTNPVHYQATAYVSSVARLSKTFLWDGASIVSLATRVQASQSPVTTSTATQKYRLGATGVRLKSALYEDGEVVDATTATSITLTLVSPSGVASEALDADSFTDPDDDTPKAFYDIHDDGLIEEAGVWTGYWTPVFPGGYSGPTSRFEFESE